MKIFKKLKKYINIDIIMRRTNKYYEEFSKDFMENRDCKLIFGVISYDDLSTNTANLLTMNDFEVCYNKHNNTYSWSIEYLYSFDNIEGKKKYVERLLNCFTKFMKENKYDTELDGFYTIFTNCTEFDTIEECYANFKYCVNGYINS